MKPIPTKIAEAVDYISGLMSTAAEDQFEDRLVDDLELQEAVIEATQLTLAIAATEPAFRTAANDVSTVRTSLKIVAAKGATAPVEGSTSILRKLSVAASLLACLLVLAVINSTVPEMRRADAATIIDSWAAAESSEPEADFDSPDFETTDLDVPDWMLTALSAVEPSEDLPAAL